MTLTVDPNGYLCFKNKRWRCALGMNSVGKNNLGKNGVGKKQHEGDGITPQGIYGLGRVFWRPDRISSPLTALSCVEITPNMGWCDDVDQDDYNQLITLPHAGHFENMWRDDHVYDLVIEVLYNTNPIIKGKGSAIFIHIAKPDYTPTQGCIALNYKDLNELLSIVNDTTMIHI